MTLRHEGEPDKAVKAVLLAAGLGTRLRPLTDRVPKCLVPVAGRPLLDSWFDALSACGIRDVLINTHLHLGQVREYLEERRRAGFTVVEHHEPTLLGSAGTIHATRGWADDAVDVLIVYTDNFSTLDVAAMLAFHRSHGDPFTMALFHAPNPAACGIAQLGDGGRVTGFVEKPAHPVGDLANAGVYVVSADAYREMADADKFDLGFDVLPLFVGRMRGFVMDGYHRDIGTPEALADVQRFAADRPRSHP